MTMAFNEVRAAVAACDPAVALQPGSPFYVDLDEAHVRSDAKCTEALRRTILFAEGTTAQLFTGFSGSGKTTELLLLKRLLDADTQVPCHTVYIDAQLYVEQHAPIQISDILRVVAFELDNEADRLSPGLSGKRFVDDLVDFFKATHVSWSVKIPIVKDTIMAELKTDPSLREEVERSLVGRFQEFVQRTRDSMVRSISAIKAKLGTGSKVVVIFDGLEKIRPLREADRHEIEATVEGVYVHHADQLKLPCDVIYTFPLWLRFRYPALANLYSRPPFILPMIRVTNEQRQENRPGIEKMLELIGKRVDLDRVFGGRKEAEAVILASGGYPRDALRMVRELLFKAPTLPASPADIATVIDEAREDYELALRDPVDAAILLDVERTRRLPTGDSAAMARFSSLLYRWFVLAYRNGTEWYDLHPLVRDVSLMKKARAERA